MAERAHTRNLALWMNGESVGLWSAGPSGDRLVYAQSWIDSSQGRPLSLSLPFRPGNPTHTGAAVRAYFDNLLPDSQPIRERMAQRFRAKTTDAFDLLAQIGRDCVGALQIVPEGGAPGNVKQIRARLIDEAGVARLLRGTLAPGLRNAQGAGARTRASAGASERDIDDFRISIAGAQEKTALLWRDGQWWLPQGSTPTTHILKMPLGLVGPQRLDLRDSVENEWLCAQILSAYGLPVARCHALRFEDQSVLGVERFDRRFADNGAWIVRLPQEDMCQATATPPHAKYEADGGPGMARIFEVLNGSRQRAQDRETFFRAQILFWLLCAPDGHAKNFSIALHPGGAYSMTPLYDVMSAYPVLGEGPGRISRHRVKLAMAVRSKNAHWRMRDILRRHWVELGRRHGVVSESGQGVDATIDDLVARTPEVLRSVSAALPKGFSNRVAEPILQGLRSAAQRLGALPS
jgi:serine/threonine-protein kinase HipA